MVLPVTGSIPTATHVRRRPLPPPPLVVAGAGASGLMLTTVLLMSPPPFASAGEAEAARLSAVRPAVIVVRVRLIGSPLDAVRVEGTFGDRESRMPLDLGLRTWALEPRASARPQRSSGRRPRRA